MVSGQRERLLDHLQVGSGALLTYRGGDWCHWSPVRGRAKRVQWAPGRRHSNRCMRESRDRPGSEPSCSDVSVLISELGGSGAFIVGLPWPQSESLSLLVLLPRRSVQFIGN